MADARQRRFRFWPRRQRAVISEALVDPPAAQELAEKLQELMQFERGIVALYYYLADETLAKLAQTLCQAHQSHTVVEPGVERDLHTKEAALASWTAVGAVWRSDVWQPGEILATFGFRMIEALRAQPEVWSVIVDPQAKFFGLATAKDEEHRYWMVITTGQKTPGVEVGSATAAR